MSNAPEYIPGTCNIGKEEIKARRNVAIISTVIAIVLIAVLLMFHTNKLWRFTLFLPATSIGIGFQQWYNKFCVAFGLNGVFNFGNIGKTFTVEQKENFQKDRAKAWKMISIGIIFGLLLAILFYFLPL
jgi:hypothetical protein